MLVDFDEYGGGQAEKGSFVRKDTYFSGPAFQLLLDGALDRVRCSHLPPVLPLQFEHGQALGDVFFKPGGELGGGGAVFGNKALKFLLRASQAWGVPDGAQQYLVSTYLGLLAAADR